ncbi:MAG: hypothetical protein ACLSD3_13125 [Acutalibacteraceae bacterium]
MFSETHRLVNYRSILTIYLESAYFTCEFEKFRSRHLGFCSRNGRQYEFRSDSYAVYSQKIGAQAIDVALSKKMTGGMIRKYFNSGYSTKQLFVILMGLLVEVDEAQLMQLEDPRCSFYSETLLTQFMRGVQAEETAPILDVPISDTEKENRIRALHGKETYKLAASYFYKGKIKKACVDARRMPDGSFLDDEGAIYKSLHNDYFR